MKKIGLLKRDRAAFLMIDMQERLMPVISDKEEVFSNANRLISGAAILNIPLIVTEQYPKGLGRTCKEIQVPDGGEVIEKICFSCMLSEAVLAGLKEKSTISLVLSGVE